MHCSLIKSQICELADFCPREMQKIAGQVLVVRSYFASNLATLFQHAFPFWTYKSLSNSPLSQIYHPPSFLINVFILYFHYGHVFQSYTFSLWKKRDESHKTLKKMNLLSLVYATSPLWGSYFIGIKPMHFYSPL